MTIMSTTDGFSRTALEAAKMNGSQDGKVFVITGAYSGIGVETTKALLEVGGKVIIGGRNEENLKKFSDEMADKYGKDKVDSFLLDLGDLASVKEFSNYIYGKYATIDVLILNAGVMNTPLGVTKNGFETQIGTNVVGHFLLAKILAPKTKRQVWVSSFGHTRDDGQRFSVEECRNFDVNAVDKYDGFHQYQQSKIGNVMLPKEFAKRYESMEAVSLHPGVIRTNLSRYMSIFQLLPLLFRVLKDGLKMKTIEQGAATTVTCATLPKVENGAYYSDCEVAQEHPNANIEEDKTALFDYCDEVTKKFQ